MLQVLAADMLQTKQLPAAPDYGCSGNTTAGSSCSILELVAPRIAVVLTALASILLVKVISAIGFSSSIDTRHIYTITLIVVIKEY
jgi:hypothetical protein